MVFSEEEITKLFRVYRTVLQMLRDRNYLVLDSEVNMTEEEFKEKFSDHMRREHLTINKTNKDNPSDQINVFFPDDEKLGVNIVKDYVKLMQTDNVHRAILVCKTKLSVHAKKSLTEMGKIRIEDFLEDELLVNITKHVLVPKHQVLTDAEKKALLQRYTVKETQLPRILMSDPVARYFGLRRGQVVKITRPSETAGIYVTYRYVV